MLWHFLENLRTYKVLSSTFVFYLEKNIRRTFAKMPFRAFTLRQAQGEDRLNPHAEPVEALWR